VPIVVLTGCPMGFVFSLHSYYKGQFVSIENILELRACQNCPFRKACFVQLDELIFGVVHLSCHSWSWRHGSNYLCSTFVVCTVEVHIYFMRICTQSLVTLQILYFPTVYTVLWVVALWNARFINFCISSTKLQEHFVTSYSLLAALPLHAGFSLNELRHWVAYEFACIAVYSIILLFFHWRFCW
jgi:hypothetical protein